MLIEFSVANFKSIRDRQTLSMVASSGGEMRDSHTFQAPLGGKSDIRLLRSAVIYGANAAGKSNFLDAIGTMSRIVGKSATEGQHGASIPVTPFRLDPAKLNKPSEFEINFIDTGVRYQYGFSATRERIVEEWLLAYPRGRAQTWLERGWNKRKKKYDWHLGSSLKGEKILWKNATRENALFISTAVQLNSQQLLPVYEGLIGIFVSIIGKRETRYVMNLDSHCTSLYCTHIGKESVLEFLRHADLDIHDVQVKPRPPETINGIGGQSTVGAFANFSKIFYETVDEKMYEVSIIRKNIKNQLISFKLDDESDGTRRLYSHAGYWLIGLQRGCVVIVDELHEYLHPKLVRYLVNLFNSEKTNPNNAQLIFASHETSFLDHEIMRRDQILFCEINSKLATEIYPLTDFHPRKGRSDLRAAYLSGSYGALPHIKEVVG